MSNEIPEGHIEISIHAAASKELIETLLIHTKDVQMLSAVDTVRIFTRKDGKENTTVYHCCYAIVRHPEEVEDGEFWIYQEEGW